MLICDCLHGDPRRQGGKKMTTKKTPQQIWDQHKAGLPLDTGHTVIEHTHMTPITAISSMTATSCGSGRAVRPTGTLSPKWRGNEVSGSAFTTEWSRSWGAVSNLPHRAASCRIMCKRMRSCIPLRIGVCTDCVTPAVGPAKRRSEFCGLTASKVPLCQRYLDFYQQPRTLCVKGDSRGPFWGPLSVRRPNYP